MFKSKRVVAVAFGALISCMLTCFSAAESAPLDKLLEYAGNCRMEQIGELLMQDPHAIVRANDEHVPLMAHAVASGLPNMVAYLLACGADPSIPDATDRTPLEIALRNEPGLLRTESRDRVVVLLCQHPDIVDLRSFAQMQAFHLALKAFVDAPSQDAVTTGVRRYRAAVGNERSRDWELLATAMDETAGLRRDMRLRACIHRLIAKGDLSPESAALAIAPRYLKHHLGDADKRDLSLSSMWAGRPQILSMLLDSNLVITPEYLKDVTNFFNHPADGSNHAPIASLLVEHGLLPKSRIDDALAWSGASGDFDMFIILAAGGGDLNAPRSPSAGCTVLMEAVASCRQYLVQYLIQREGTRLDIDARSIGGATALHSAYKFKNEKAVQWLLDAGANPAAKDDSGRRPREYR